MNDDETTDAAPKTTSIRKILATLPSGLVASELTFDELSKYLREQLKTDGEDDRNRRHVLRDDLYRDGGTDAMRGVIDEVFIDTTIKDLRKKWVKYARFNNVTKRIVNELSTVYAQPAKRTVAGDENNRKYQAVLEAVHIDELSIRWGRLANLHRVVFVGFRVRQHIDGRREPVLDIATPANVRVVLHPNDDKVVVGIAVRASYRTARPSADKPAWTLWTDHEVMQLRADFSVITPSYQEHKLGVCPWVPLELGVTESGFWPGSEGEDLVAAHMSIWMTNVLLLKETKSATKQQIVSGDGTATARGQAADTEVPTELADGQSVTTVDMSVDLEMYTGTADHVLDCVANNHGMAPALVRHQGIQSAEARDLMRIPIRELRTQQLTPIRRFEMRLAIVMAAVLASDLPAMEFSVEGWRVEFGESQTPMSRTEQNSVFVLERDASLTTTVDRWLELHPGATLADAWDEIERNIITEARVEAWRARYRVAENGRVTRDQDAPGRLEKPGADPPRDDNGNVK